MCEKKIEVLNNFVNEDVFYPKAASEKSEEKNIIRVLFSGSLDERKGISTLIQFSEFIESYSGKYKFKLIIASNTKSEYHHFEDKQNTEIISGLGIEQMPDFYRSGDILFLASGLPVIGTDFAIPDEIKNFDFCRRHNFTNLTQTADQIISLYETFHNKKTQIAEETIKGFGKKQYEEKLINFTKAALGK